MLNNLPKNWCECKFSDVCYLQNGYAFDSKSYKEKGTYLIRISDIQNNEVHCTNCVKVTEEVDKCFTVSYGDFLLAMSGATTGKTGVYKDSDKALLNQRVGNLKIYDENIIIPKFRNYFISSKRQEIEKLAYGGAQPNISKSMIENLKMLLPPLEEQGRIVEKIEELFSDIDNGIKDLKTAQAQIKQYRQSVLKSAFEGKLTDHWRQLHKCEKNMEIKEETGIYKIPHSWLWCKLTAIGTLNRGKSKHRPRNDKKLYGGKYPFIQTGDVKEANMYIHKYSQTYNDFGLSQSKLWNENTLCITIAANIAETAILKIKACFPDSIVGFVKNKYLYSEELVEYYFRTIKGKLEKYAPATAQKNINLSVLNDILFPLPSLPEQQQIVAEIEKRFVVADEMEKAVNDSLLQAEKLKQSILKQAFAGKLVPQNPNDEPAAVLLERIKAAKENHTKGKK